MGRDTHIFASCLAAALLALPATAVAHPLIDRARERFEQAEFDEALELFAQAEEADDLSREDLIQLYLKRALVYHALDRDEDLELDLFRLATIEPDMEFTRRIPPRVRSAFAEAAGEVDAPIRIAVDSSREDGWVRLEPRLENDQAALVREIRLGARVTGEWLTAVNESLEMEAGPEERVDYWAEAVGPGGAVIATQGSRSEPRILGPAGAVAEGGTGTGTGTDGGEGSGSGTGGGVPWWPFAVGGAAAAAGAVVLVVLLSGGNDNTFVPGPTCCEDRSGMP